MKLEYLDLISPYPFYLNRVGNIISPKLKDIHDLGIGEYRLYLNIISMNIESFFEFIKQEETYNNFTEEEKEQLSLFNLLTSDETFLSLLNAILNFFIVEEVIWSKENDVFLIYKSKEDKEIIGVISNNNYTDVCNIICQRCYVDIKIKEEPNKIKSKKALEILKKIQVGREKNKKQTKADPNMELGNIISAVSNKSCTLNPINIWDLTVYQLWDSFERLVDNNIYQIQSMSVATWGDKDKTFDASSWFKKKNNL